MNHTIGSEQTNEADLTLFSNDYLLKDDEAKKVNMTLPINIEHHDQSQHKLSHQEKMN